MCLRSTFVTIPFLLDWMYVLTMLDADPQYSNGKGFFAIYFESLLPPANEVAGR